MRHIAWVVPLVLLAACDKPGGDRTSAAGSTAAAPSGKPAKAAKPAETASSAKPAKAAKPAEPSKVSNGPFTPFGQFVNDACDALLKAVRGEKIDPKWGLEPLNEAEADKLKFAKQAYASVEVEAVHDTHGYLRTNVVVFPDNRVRWVNLEYRSRTPLVKPTNGIKAASPFLNATTEHLIKALTGESCELPLLTRAEVEALPGGQFRDLTPVLTRTCRDMKGKAEGWVPRYDDITVVLDDRGAVVAVRSGIRVEDGKLVLVKPRVRRKPHPSDHHRHDHHH